MAVRGMIKGIKGNQCLVLDAAGQPKAVITDTGTGKRLRRRVR